MRTVVVGATVGVLFSCRCRSGHVRCRHCGKLGLTMSAADLGLVDPVWVEDAVPVNRFDAVRAYMRKMDRYGLSDF